MLEMNGNGFLAQEVQLRAVPLPDFPPKKTYVFALAFPSTLRTRPGTPRLAK